MSSAGVLVASETQLRPGARVELSIEWPSLLDGQVPLQLVAAGTIVRCEASYFAVRLIRHQFRTTRKRLP
jgi:hypothetical protein